MTKTEDTYASGVPMHDVLRVEVCKSFRAFHELMKIRSRLSGIGPAAYIQALAAYKTNPIFVE